MVDPALKKHIEFKQLNLLGDWPYMEYFDVIFLRNVMIYFDGETKSVLMEKLMQKLKPGGLFFIGHSESLNGVYKGLETVFPSVYRKPLPGESGQKSVAASRGVVNE